VAASSSAESFDVRSNLPAIMQDLKRISPKLATGTRAALKDAGQSIIQHQQEILFSESVGGVVSKKTYSGPRPNSRGGYRRGPRARELGGARLISVEAAASARGYHTGLRDQMAANLKTQVRTPRTGRGAAVRVASKKPFWFNKALNAKTWRHPLFGNRNGWVVQSGNQYFRRGAKEGVVEARNSIIAVVEEAANLIKSHPVQ